MGLSNNFFSIENYNALSGSHLDDTKHENYYPEESGGAFYSYLKNFKDTNNVVFYVDSLNFEKETLHSYFTANNIKCLISTKISPFDAE